MGAAAVGAAAGWARTGADGRSGYSSRDPASPAPATPLSLHAPGLVQVHEVLLHHLGVCRQEGQVRIHLRGGLRTEPRQQPDLEAEEELDPIDTYQFILTRHT
jgi:hypothetical protein